MESTCEINDEMIKMRKEIKRGKIWAITKLVRNVRNLRNKKGNEMQVSKNKRRAERLVEEIDIIKDLKPDDVFKALLNSDLKLSSQSLMNSDLPLMQRAIIRIGSATFIQNRMSDIKEKVSSFHFERTSKQLPKTIDAPELVKEDATEAVKQDPESTLESRLRSTPEITLSNKLEPEKSEQLINSEKDEQRKKALETIAVNEKEILDVIDSTEDENNNNNERPNYESDNDANSDNAEESDDNDSTYENDDFETISATKASPTVKEKVIGTTAEGYQIVLPLLPTTAREEVTSDENKKKSFNTISEGAEDVTDVLPNIGENFNSDDENSASDIELEDLAASALKSRQDKEKGDKNQGDFFFLDTKGSSDKKFQHFLNKSDRTAESSDDETMKQVKSCFVESLASVSHQRTKGKNRMSQRARKSLHSKKKFGGENNDKNHSALAKKPKTTPKAKNMQTKPTGTSQKVNEVQPVHPSWEASRKRKEQQSALKQFKGKRVCFDDSD